MYISKLSLYGFKSFLKKSEVIFGRGITSVVGPNGCGKTNIVDAIRWVIGEQKSSILRAERNSDVIFNGTATRRPVNFAEVALTIHNDQKKINLDYSEIIISRRVYRNGESEYFINNTLCRLKDITNLFIDTGMGNDAYSIIELKMIENILSEAPGERKRLFEEAAGVNKYRIQRQSAMRKLEATEDDFNRVNDIISEVDSKVKSLKRQLKRYEKYKETTQKLIEAEVALASGRVNSLEQKIKPLNKQFDDNKAFLKKTNIQLEKQEQELQKNQTILGKQETILQEKSKELDNLKNERNQVKTEGIVLNEQNRNIEQTIERLDFENRELQKNQTESERKIVTLNENRKQLFEELQKKRESYKKISAELEKIEQEYKALNDEVQILQEKRYTLLKDQAEIKARYDSLRENIAQRKNENEALTIQIQEQSKTKKEIESSINDLQKMIVQIKVKIMDNKESLGFEEQKFNEIHEEEQQLNQEIRGIESNLDKIKNKIEFYSSIIQSKEGFEPGLQYVLDNIGEFPGIKGALSDLLSVDSKYYLAVEAVIKDVSRLLIAENNESALQTLEILASEEKGKVSIIPLDVKLKTKNIAINNPKLKPLITFIKCQEDLKELKFFLFNNIYCCNDEDFNSLINDPENQNLAIVSDKGRFRDISGIFSGGADTSEANILVGRSEKLYSLETDFDKLTQEKQGVDDQLVKLKEDLQFSRNNQNELKQKIQHLEKDSKNRENQLREWERKLFQSASIINTLEENRISVKVAIESFEKKYKSKDPKATGSDQQLDKSDRDLKIEKEKLSKLKENLGNKTHFTQNQRIELINKENEYKNLLETIEITKRGIVTIKQKLEKIGTEKEKCVRIKSENNSKVDNINKKFQNIEKLVSDSEKEVSQIRNKYLHLRKLIEDINQSIYMFRHDKEKFSEIINKTELEKSKLIAEEKEIRAILNEKYNKQIILELSDDFPTVEESRKMVERYKRKLELIGMVNMAVKDEFEEESSRLNFLNEQKNDLVESEKGLKEIITQIDNIAREKFLEVFHQIKENFQSTFKMFFDGGEADLKLVGDPDPLEAKIEIWGCPSGKKMRSLKMLSAGEKTLTAIALLFGIYQVKPSPFCILDEVDAPLDDSNTRRFTKMIKAFADKTQFIIVTHNKVTMNVADILYGVTMGERGVSQIVSVKMN